MENTKISFEFTPADMEIVERIRRSLEKDHGPITTITVMRSALRKAAKGLPK